MAALAASDVTITVQLRDRSRKRKRNQVKIAFGDAALTYPAAGVPLPAKEKFGMSRVIDQLHLSDPSDASGIVWKYDKDNHKLRGYRQNIRTGSTAAADSTSGALAESSQAAEVALRAMGTAIDTDYDVGLLAELGTAHAPAAQVLYGEAIGW